MGCHESDFEPEKGDWNYCNQQACSLELKGDTSYTMDDSRRDSKTVLIIYLDPSQYKFPKADHLAIQKVDLLLRCTHGRSSRLFCCSRTVFTIPRALRFLYPDAKQALHP